MLDGPCGRRRGNSMITVNNRTYKTYLLDTNIVIQLLKDKEIFGSKIMNLILGEGIFVISPVSLWELSIDFDIFNEFKKIFLVIPTILVRAYDEILQKECELYEKEKPTIIDNGVFLNEPYFKNSNISIESIINQHVSKTRSEMYKAKERNTFFDIRKDTTVGFIEKNKKNDKKQIKESVELYAYEIIARTNIRFAQKIAKRKEALDIYRFPSAISMSYIYHYKFINQRKKGEPSDLSDILISPILPYVDCYITERSLASNINEIKNGYNYYQNLEVLRMKDIN